MSKLVYILLLSSPQISLYWFNLSLDFYYSNAPAAVLSRNCTFMCLNCHQQRPVVVIVFTKAAL